MLIGILALIALAFGATSLAGWAGASAPDSGRFAIAAGTNFYMVLDTVIGDVRVCIVTATSCQELKRQ